jgi:hypothetical protein
MSSITFWWRLAQRFSTSFPDASQPRSTQGYLLTREAPSSARVDSFVCTKTQALRARGVATVPSTLGEEKLTNPFMRYREKSIADLLKSSGRLNNEDPIAAFAALREWKNSFR